MNIELMEKKLYDACLEGDVETLEASMREDKLIISRISLFSCFNQTPLHLACMLGHFEFTKSLLSCKPDFASRLDSQGCSPLHLASANGYANIVALLLQHNLKMCRVRDEDGRTPLHLAVMNGQYESVRELIKVDSDSYNEELGTALHLCVMYNRFNVLVLVSESNDQNISNFKDDKGNTILHSATNLRRVQIIKYLVTSRSEVLDVNAVNKSGLTALDIIEQMPRDVKTLEIKELLISACIIGVTDNNRKRVKMSKNSKNFSIFPKKQKKKDKNLLVAASLIAAMAYQAVLSPPGGLASVDADHLAPIPSYETYDLKPATSLRTDYSDEFWICNTISFIAALCVIFLYVCGASLQQRFLVWFVRLGMCIPLSAMTFAYIFAVEATNPYGCIINKSFCILDQAFSIGILAWIAVTSLLILVLVYRFLRYTVRIIIKIIKWAIKKKKKNNTSEEAEAAARFRTPNTNIV